jgi:exodeoxyribonuclease-3
MRALKPAREGRHLERELRCRAREDLVLDWVEREDPDVLLHAGDQDWWTRSSRSTTSATWTTTCESPGAARLQRRGHPRPRRLHGRRGHRNSPDDDGRYRAAPPQPPPWQAIRVASVYLPNGQDLQSDKFTYKLAVDRPPGRATWPPTTPPTRRLVLCGDYNLCPQKTRSTPGTATCASGYIHVEPPRAPALPAPLGLGPHRRLPRQAPRRTRRRHSWWDYRAGAWERDHGLRIDLHLVTAPIWARTRDVVIDRDARGEDKASDHAPVTLILDT